MQFPWFGTQFCLICTLKYHVFSSMKTPTFFWKIFFV